MTRLTAWVTILIGCSLPLMAAGQNAGSVRWQTPRGCPTQAAVQRLLARVEAAARLQVEGLVERVQRGYRLRLRVEGSEQRFERELTASSCELLAESAVFFVQLAETQLRAAGSDAVPAAESSEQPYAGRAGAPEIAGNDDAEGAAPRSRSAERDAAGAGPTGSARVAPGPTANRGAAPVPSAPDAAPVDSEWVSTGLPETTRDAPGDSSAAAESGDPGSHGSWSLRLGFGAAMIEAGLTGVTPHLSLDLSLVLADWSVGVRLGALLHPALRVTEGADVDLQTNAAQLIGCHHWDVASVLFGPCVALSALRSSAESTGLTGQQRSGASWFTAGPALQLQLRLARKLLLGIEIGAWAALSPRPSFEVAGNTVARAGTLAGYARLGAAYELW